MFKDIQEIEKIVYDFCDKKNLKKETFEISTISKATGGESQKLCNTTKVKNKDCTYVVKFYSNLNLIIIWNYRLNQQMNVSLKTLNEKLENGIRYMDKGIEFHNRKQYHIYFDRGERLSELLHLIIQ